jgi:Rrf2 family nitric oxide-sensitive transcriptional repressor
MHLTFHTDYALRLLMLLAVEPGARHTVQEVARRHQISRNHLMKVTQTLSRAGFVQSSRGRRGGLKLARTSASINLGAVLRATEDSLALVECFDRSRNRCAISGSCGLRGPLDDALHAFLAVLDGHSLADLVKNPVSVRRLRGLPPALGSLADQVHG